MIISADKFGDVYSLPILPSTETSEQTPTPKESSRARSKQWKPQANQFTVHTKRNLRALEHQQRTIQADQSPRTPNGDTEEFEHNLLLGHVSMLTAAVLSSQGQRQYILTADRDEHIRVSRGVPQAHIIEAFCLGHTEFVSRLCVPHSRPEILISGGGDNELFIWDWSNGRLVSRTALLDHVRTLSPDLSKIAVSGLFSCRDEQTEDPGKAEPLVFAICERFVVILI